MLLLPLTQACARSSASPPFTKVFVTDRVKARRLVPLDPESLLLATWLYCYYWCDFQKWKISPSLNPQQWTQKCSRFYWNQSYFSRYLCPWANHIVELWSGSGWVCGVVLNEGILCIHQAINQDIHDENHRNSKQSLEKEKGFQIFLPEGN